MKHWWVPWKTILPGTSQDSFQLGWNGYSTRTKLRGIAYIAQGRSNMVQPVPLSLQSRMAKLVVQSFFVGYNLVWPLPRKATKKGTIDLKVKKSSCTPPAVPNVSGRLRCRELKNWLISASSSWISTGFPKVLYHVVNPTIRHPPMFTRNWCFSHTPQVGIREKWA